VRRLALLSVLLVVGCCGVATPAGAALPPIKHVFVIWLENEDAKTSFGPNSPAPYLGKTLPSMGAFLPNYYGIGHESLDNYIAAVSGQGPNPQTQADCQIYSDFQGAAGGPDGQAMGTGCVYPVGVQTIADQLQVKGLPWKGYMEDMAASGGPANPTCVHPALNQHDSTQSATAQSQYAARHNPFVYFHSIVDSPSCKEKVVDFQQLASDLTQAGTTPAFSWITPDLCDDGHDATCANPAQKGGFDGINNFLSAVVPQILASPGYKDDGLLVVTFDESASDDTSCCGETASNTPNAAGPSPGSGGGKVGAVLVSPFIKPGTVDDTPYNHYSALRTYEDIFGLGHLGYAGVDGLAPIGDKTFDQIPALPMKVAARRMNRNHIRFTVQTDRQATVVFGGVCTAPARPTSEDGARTITVRYSRAGHCRVGVTRPAWQGATRSFKLRAPKRVRLR
jgi:hypothetical protein